MNRCIEGPVMDGRLSVSPVVEGKSVRFHAWMDVWGFEWWMGGCAPGWSHEHRDEGTSVYMSSCVCKYMARSMGW